MRFFYLAVRPNNKREWAPWAKNLGIFLLAGVLPFTLTCALLYRAGVFHNFWFWTFSYASHYATAVSLRTGLGALTDNFSDNCASPNGSGCSLW